jgi:HEPN domain-containing protein
MTPEQQRLLDKAERTLQAARVLSDRGFFDNAKFCLSKH